MPSNRLINASQAPRCQHLKVNGLQCGSPARHGRRYCCFHDSAVRRNREFVLPIVEDCASLQLALNKIMQALIDKLIDQKTASTLLYGLQIAFANLKQLKGEQRVDDYERALQARHEQQRHQPNAAPPGRQPVTHHPITPSPDHPIADRQSPIANGPLPPASAAEPASPVDEFLRKFTNQKSQITSKKENEKEPRFDINACADPALHRFDVNASADPVPQGRTLVAQDGSPGTGSRASSKSRRDGAGLHVSRRDSICNRQSAIGNAFALVSPAVFLDSHRENSSNGQHGC